MVRVLTDGHQSGVSRTLPTSPVWTARRRTTSPSKCQPCANPHVSTFRADISRESRRKRPRHSPCRTTLMVPAVSLCCSDRQARRFCFTWLMRSKGRGQLSGANRSSAAIVAFQKVAGFRPAQRQCGGWVPKTRRWLLLVALVAIGACAKPAQPPPMQASVAVDSPEVLVALRVSESGAAAGSWWRIVVRRNGGAMLEQSGSGVLGSMRVGCGMLPQPELSRLEQLVGAALGGGLRETYSESQRPGPQANYVVHRVFDFAQYGQLRHVTIIGWADAPPVLTQLHSAIEAIRPRCHR